MRAQSILAAVFAAVAVAAGCGDDPAGFAPGGGGDPAVEDDAGAGSVCARPEEGCPCEPGTAPVACYGEPEAGDDGSVLCSGGSRYCRDGVWTGCESVREWVVGEDEGVGSASAALVSGPTPCSVCNPDCSVARDYPTDADLPGSSTGVVYDPGAGGIILDSGGVITVPLPDADGDGVPDVADECAGTGWRAPCDGDASDDGFYHTLPYGGPSVIDPLEIMVQVRTADVYFLMDTTGSMGGEIANLRSSLTSGTFLAGCSGGIVGAIRCTIPDAWFGVGRFEDYPIDVAGPILPYGDASAGDRPYVHMQDILESVATTQATVNTLVTRNGADIPESHSQALYSMATGAALGSYTPARSGCAAGTWGYPCFRDGAIPVVVMFTDAPIHNGPNGYQYMGFGDPLPTTGTPLSSPSTDTQCRASVCSYDPYCCTTAWDSICASEVTRDCACWVERCSSSCSAPPGPAGYPVQWCHTVQALADNEVKVITINSGTGRPDATALANATGSYSSSGSPYVFDIAADGSGLSTAVVDAVVELANYSRMDITARALDNPATGAFDETAFVASITAVGWGPGSCTGISGSTFLQCLPGTDVDFRVEFRNDVVMPTTVPQVFDFWIEVVGDGSYRLELIPVRIVVPAEVISYPPSGSYWRDYDATVTCEIPPQRPDWGEFTWTATTDPDSRIRFDFQTADTLAGLSSATVVSVSVPGTAPPVDVGSLLVASGETNFKPYLRVTAVLFASTDTTVTPVLTGFEMRFTCMASE